MKTRRAVTVLAFAALFFAILLPPEAYPDGKLVVILCATFSFFVSLAERRIPRAYIYGGLASFAFLILHSVFVSVDAFRSLEFLSVLWAYYCLFGFFLYAEFEAQKPLAVCMVILSAIVAGYGLYQYFWGFEQMYNLISYAGTDQVFKVPALSRIGTGRVFSTLALANTLWGFLTIALPFHAALWNENRWIKGLLAVSGAMLLVTGFLTRSFGFLVGLFVLAAAWLFLRHRRLLWQLAPVALVLILIAGAFYWARRDAIEAANPVVLRVKNWVAAWSIFAAHPMGAGLNNYGVVYPQYMLPGANATQYTHNTALQLLSELGYPILIAAAVLLVVGLRNWRRGEYRQLSPYIVIALIVWAVHNLIDINVYFPSLGVIGAVLLGVLLKKPSVTATPEARIGSGVIVAFGVVVLIFASFVMVSSELQHRAQIEFDENRLQAAAETLESAKTLMPLNSSLFHDSGEINLNLYHRSHGDVRYLEKATNSFRRAIALSPEKIGPHIGMSLCLSSMDHVGDALEEIRVAERLDPEGTNAQAIARIIEKRQAGMNKPVTP
jgi:tetratricopeptide (TPR) repeat protein